MHESCASADDDFDLQWMEVLETSIANQLVGLIDSSIADGGTLGYLEPMTPPQAASFVESIRWRLARSGTHLLIARQGGQVVFLCLLTTSDMPTCSHRGELSKGVVGPGHRGMHLIPKAFRAIVDKCEALGVEQLVLDVREGTRAQQLWLRFGFAVYGVMEDYARVHGQVHRGLYLAQSVRSLKSNLSRRRAA